MLLAVSLGQTILVSTIVFLFVIFFLVIVLLYARAKLVPSGPVKLTINNDKEFETTAGTTLLNTMTNLKIFYILG